MSFVNWLTILNREVVACTRCPRLVTYREQVARRTSGARIAIGNTGASPCPASATRTPVYSIMGLAPRCARLEPDGPPVHRRCFRQFHVPRIA